MFVWFYGSYGWYMVYPVSRVTTSIVRNSSFLIKVLGLLFNNIGQTK